MCGESGACYGTDGLRDIECEIPLVGVGEGAKLEEDIVCQELGAVYGGVVYLGDIDEIEDCESTSVVLIKVEVIDSDATNLCRRS